MIRTRVVVAGLGVAAGIHLAVAGTHELASAHGAFFAVVGLVQLVLAAVVARAMTRSTLVLAAVSSVALLAVWFTQRVGPAAPEGPGVLDTVASASELLVAVAASSLLLVGSTGRVRTLPRSATVALVGVVAVLSFAASPAEHDDHHAGEARRAAAALVESPLEESRHRHSYGAAPTADVVPAPADPHLTGEPHEH